MISSIYNEDVFVSDYTQYSNGGGILQASFRGVVIDTEDKGIIPSFLLTDRNRYPFVSINNERNPALFRRIDGTICSQCECIFYAHRNDNRRGWMMFLELKYCKPNNIHANISDGISQLIATIRLVMDEKKVFDKKRFKKYLVISTPGIKPIDPFDSFYFSQDFLLTIKEETGATLVASNEAHILTPANLYFNHYC